MLDRHSTYSWDSWGADRALISNCESAALLALLQFFHMFLAFLQEEAQLEIVVDSVVQSGASLEPSERRFSVTSLEEARK